MTQGSLLARHLGDPSNGVHDPPLENFNWNTAAEVMNLNPLESLAFSQSSIRDNYCYKNWNYLESSRRSMSRNVLFLEL